MINLDRQQDRWAQVSREFNLVLDSSRVLLAKRVIRHSAIDARSLEQSLPASGDIEPFYTLRDQLFVEPQPRAFPDRLELDRPIRMSEPEIAVALSHISVWRRIAASEHAYALVLEDDVWFRQSFARHLDQAWGEMTPMAFPAERFDLLYLSYTEVRGGAPKTFVSPNVFRPIRGLWCLSGYVLSRKGAEKLLELLPCRGPVDLWINQQFAMLNVRATKRPIISQRSDGSSTNSYSVLPSLTKIGVLDSGGESLFQIRPREKPVFAFGPEGSRLSSLAMALSMLGYRCCSDVEDLPASEVERLLAGRNDRVFDAYVNIGSLADKVETLNRRYPRAKFILTTMRGRAVGPGTPEGPEPLSGTTFAVLPAEATNKWKVLCEHLGCPPPLCPFPELDDIGQRPLVVNDKDPRAEAGNEPKRDKSPWVVEAPPGWRGVRSAPARMSFATAPQLVFTDHFERLDVGRWLLRDDTFSGNLALFRPTNVELRPTTGAVLRVKKELLGVRDYSAGSISSRDRFLYGRFEVVLQATKVPGVVTGFFLHRDTPRQEIDVEIVGNRSDWLLINVFYNPGGEGANFDYGYRGAPTRIKLGFDASAAPHRYAIEWGPSLIRWLVDERVVHERANWDPTPIPHLPMTLHVNIWPSRASELAGRLVARRLPATAVIRAITVEAAVASEAHAGQGTRSSGAARA
ncbi:MAG: family 16 glycosylhydrolase [Chloroflexota bacterium]|nr:family 16 glycosylhydrolase [Chloroflexota bacterium]